jgi:hypothetical protein
MFLPLAKRARTSDGGGPWRRKDAFVLHRELQLQMLASIIGVEVNFGNFDVLFRPRAIATLASS